MQVPFPCLVAFLVVSARLGCYSRDGLKVDRGPASRLPAGGATPAPALGREGARRGPPEERGDAGAAGFARGPAAPARGARTPSAQASLCTGPPRAASFRGELSPLVSSLNLT